MATRELVILRAAILQHSMYEWHQHVRIGQQAGLTARQIIGLHHWRQKPRLLPVRARPPGYTDALAATDHPAADVYDELAAEFPPATVVGVTILAAFYFATAKFLGSMEVQTETPFVGWEVAE